MNASENTATVNSPTFTPFFQKAAYVFCTLSKRPITAKSATTDSKINEGSFWKTVPTLVSTFFAHAIFLLFSAMTTKRNIKVSSRGFWRDGCAFKNGRKTSQSVHVSLNSLVQKTELNKFKMS